MYYRELATVHEEAYAAIIADVRRYASTSETRDREAIDKRVWSQFKEVIERGKPYWTEQDYKTLLGLLEK